MCKITQKCMFLCGLGFHLLVYFCATGLTDVYVVNNHEKGGSIKNLNSLEPKNFSKKKENIFLDSLTGDHFSYNYEMKKWLPTGNVGLHDSRANETIEKHENAEKKQKYKT